MQALRRKVKGLKFKAVEDGLLQQRAVKDEDEINCIRQALRIQQQAFIELLTLIEPGVTENDLAAELEYRMRRLGADGPSFHTIVAFDANAALPHAIPGMRKLKNHGLVLIDWGAKYGGYCADLTRVVAVGRVSRRLREIYQVCRAAQLAAIERLLRAQPSRPWTRWPVISSAKRDTANSLVMVWAMASAWISMSSLCSRFAQTMC